MSNVVITYNTQKRIGDDVGQLYVILVLTLPGDRHCNGTQIGVMQPLK